MSFLLASICAGKRTFKGSPRPLPASSNCDPPPSAGLKKGTARACRGAEICAGMHNAKGSNDTNKATMITIVVERLGTLFCELAA